MKKVKILATKKKAITAGYILLWVGIGFAIIVVGYAIFTASEVGLIGQ